MSGLLMVVLHENAGVPILFYPAACLPAFILLIKDFKICAGMHLNVIENQRLEGTLSTQ